MQVADNGVLRDATPEEEAEYAALVFVVPTVPAFPNLEPYQFHAMIGLTGYGPDIEAAIAADPDPMFAAAATAKYLYSTYYKRDDPFVVALASAIGLTDAELDTIWLNASEF